MVIEGKDQSSPSLLDSDFHPVINGEKKPISLSTDGLFFAINSTNLSREMRSLFHWDSMNSSNPINYLLNLLLANTPAPIKPNPRRSMVAGSGTAAGTYGIATSLPSLSPVRWKRAIKYCSLSSGGSEGS